MLTNGTILTGTLNLFVERDVLILACPNDSTYTLPARLVRGFAAKDDPAQHRKGESFISLQRIYRTFPLPPDKTNAPIAIGFYEQLSRGTGPVLLLRREYVVPCNVPIMGINRSANGEILSIASNTNCDTATKLFLRTATGDVIMLNKPQEVLDYFPREAKQLRAYVAENDLRYPNLRDLSLLVNYTNALLAKKAL